MNFHNNLCILHYKANAGGGVIFTAKTIVVDGSESLYIISPKNFNDEECKFLKSTPKNLIFISPNNVHNIHLKKMNEKFPTAKFYGPKRSAKQSGVDLDKTSSLNSSEELIPIFIEGCKTLSETCFYHDLSKTMIATDLLFNMKHEMNLASRMAFTMAGAYHKLNMSRLIRISRNDKKAFKVSIEKLLDYPFETMILNHGENISRSDFEKWLSKNII